MLSLSNPALSPAHQLCSARLIRRDSNVQHRLAELARLPPRRHASVDLVELQLPRIEGLLDGTESTTTNRRPGDRLEWEAVIGYNLLHL